MKRPVTTPSDDKTRQFILSMMEGLPTELLKLATELRDTSAVIRSKADALDHNTQAAYEQLKEDLASQSARIDLLLQIVKELCDLASKGTAIKPMWNIMQESQIDSSEKRDE